MKAFGRSVEFCQFDQRLADAHISPIWYPEGEHEYVEQILTLLLDYPAHHLLRQSDKYKKKDELLAKLENLNAQIF